MRARWAKANHPTFKDVFCYAAWYPAMICGNWMMMQPLNQKLWASFLVQTERMHQNIEKYRIWQTSASPKGVFLFGAPLLHACEAWFAALGCKQTLKEPSKSNTGEVVNAAQISSTSNTGEAEDAAPKLPGKAPRSGG